MNNNKEIIALDIFEALRLRPEMYISQVSPMDDKLPIIRNGKLQAIDKTWSPGFMHLIVEILENAIDEAKRMKGKMKNIWVSINLDTNEVTVRDEGMGFHRAASRHSKTKKNVVRTAYEELHAGSNFIDTSINIIGTHGVGSAVCNILSKHFEVNTTNRTHNVHYVWDDYKVVSEKKEKRAETDQLGTTVSFIPSPETFPNYKWDKELIETYLAFKQFLIGLDPIIGKNLKLHCNFIQQEIEIPINVSNFLPEDTLRISNKEWGTIILWPSYENSCSVSFINGSQCTGIHQRIINDWINEYFEYNLAHHFYETLVSLNVPSTLMRFADQNKTKYAVSRFEIEDILKNIFHNKIINSLKGSRITQEIEKRIEDRLYSENIKVIKKAQRTSRRKISDKYSAASKYKESIFVTEGISASGSLRQARDPETEAVYSLKGKIKNTRRLSDLTSNAEILEIMSILNMTPNEKKKPAYDNIIIATDSDEDGNHITSLIINLFYKWFPYIIEDGRLFKLTTPLVVCDYKNERKYFLTSEEFHKFSEGKSVSNVNYLKGLGSLSIEDWKYVMNNKILLKIIDDRSAKRFLNIAFGDSTALRKEWLAKK